MIRSLFVSLQELNKGARRPSRCRRRGSRPSRHRGRFMGAGIAYVTALAGINVVLIDRDQSAADRGKEHSQKAHDPAGRAWPRHGGGTRRLAGAHHRDRDYDALEDCDMVIEAVFEDRNVKAEAIARTEAVIGDHVVFGSNTSTLAITSLAKLSKRPACFIGVHFFSPVERMLLVEIIVGKATGDAALAAALDYVRAIRRTPIVVNDSRGFYTSRVVGTYLREGHLMLAEGVPAAMIENVARMAGMPVGPPRSTTRSRSICGWKS